jgi:NADH-quinone oxidoreductase subunit J
VLELVFFVLAAITVLSALGVIFVKDIFRSALCLILLFMAVAGLYFLLHADFLGVVQILIYVGAVSILIIVAIMLTRDARQGQPLGAMKYLAGLFSLLLLGTIIFGMVNAGFTISSAPPIEPTVAPLGQKLFGDGGYLITVEIAAVLLLSAMLGAIVILRDQ